MRKEASLEQWRELYDVAIEIKELEPWKYLWDMDVITIIPSRLKEPIYCSIMGRGGGFFGVGSYFGFKAINNFYKMAENNNIPQEQMIRYQDDNIIMCYFGSREELTNKELKLIKDLGLKFRGKNNWIYFHSFKKGYMPFVLDEEEVIRETEVLQHLYMSLKAFIEHGLKVDFENGMSLVRTYDNDEELWLNFEAPIPLHPEPYPEIILQDDLLIAKLNKQKVVNDSIEIDITYLNAVVNDKKYDRPVNPRICIIASRTNGMIIDQSMLSPDDDEIQAIFNMVVNYISNIGKPKTIFVRDEYIMSILKNLCERINIELKIKGRLKVVDNFVKEFANFGI
jgi:hypothetical protein